MGEGAEGGVGVDGTGLYAGGRKVGTDGAGAGVGALGFGLGFGG